MTEAVHHGTASAVAATRGRLTRWLLPSGVDAGAWFILVGRALRGFATATSPCCCRHTCWLRLTQWAVGLVSSATLIGSALATILVGMLGSRFAPRRLLMLAAALMAATGVGFAGLSDLWPLLAIVCRHAQPQFRRCQCVPPLEQARLAESALPDARTALFARYSLIGAFSAAIGALAAALPGWLATHSGLSFLAAMRAMFFVYALIGVALWVLYARLPLHQPQSGGAATPLGPSRGIVIRLALLFSVDAFAGGLVVNALLSLWLMQRFGLARGRRPVLLLCGAADDGVPARRRAPRARSACSTRWCSRISRPASA
jgi:MFS family permease